MRKYKNDIILIAGILLLILLGMLLYFTLQTKDNLKVSIYYDKELVKRVDLNQENEFEINQVVILIKNNEVRVISSVCKDQICVHQGKIQYAGQTITCLPQKVFIQIEGSEVDVGI